MKLFVDAERGREELPSGLRSRYFVWTDTGFVRLNSLAR